MIMEKCVDRNKWKSIIDSLQRNAMRWKTIPRSHPCVTFKESTKSNEQLLSYSSLTFLMEIVAQISKSLPLPEPE